MAREVIGLIIGILINTIGVLLSFLGLAYILPQEMLDSFGSLAPISVIVGANLFGGFCVGFIARRRELLLGAILGLILDVTVVIGTTGAAFMGDIPELIMVVIMTTIGAAIAYGLNTRLDRR